MANSSRISFNLDTFDRNVRECNPQAIEDAANLGADLEKMESGESARFRASISRYREDCTCVRIPRATKERAKEMVCEIKGKISKEKEKAAPTIEKIKVGIAPTIETAKEKAAPTIQKIKERIMPRIEELRKKYYTA